MVKSLKVLCSLMMLVTTSLSMVSNVMAAPTVVAKVSKNGSLVELGPNETATGTVTLVSDTACQWYRGNQIISDGYKTTITINEGYGSVECYCIDQSGQYSNTVSITLDSKPNYVYTSGNTATGDTAVTVFALRDSYFVIDGVKQSTLSKSYTVTGNGNHTVYAVGVDGTKTKEITFTIPYNTTNTVTTVTTTTRKPTTSGSKVTTTTTSYKGSTSIDLKLRDLAEGAVTNGEVVLEADQNAYFVINGEKQAKAAKTYTLNQEGSYSVYATNATNTVNSVTYTFTIDKTAANIALKVNNETVAPGVLEDAVTLVTDEVGFFYVNGEQANIREQNELVISESGTYQIEFVDIAGNSSVVNFVVDMPEETNTNNTQTSTSSNGLIYMVGGAVLGGAVVAIVMALISRRKNAEDDEEDDDEE